VREKVEVLSVQISVMQSGGGISLGGGGEEEVKQVEADDLD
jgi:hypothetical protein